MSIFTQRIIRAAKLDVSVYEEVEADKGAMGQAIGVVIISSAASGIGMLPNQGIGVIFWTMVSALVTWYIWAYVTYLIGTRLLPEPQTSADLGELLRTIGFSSSPGIIRILGVIQGFREFIFFVASIWMLIAMVIAVRQALDYSGTGRAVGVCIIGWIIQAVIFAFLIILFGGPVGTT